MNLQPAGFGQSKDQVLQSLIRPNNRINSDWQFRYAPLPAGYAERYKS